MKTANLPVYGNIAMLTPFGILISWTNVLLLYNFYWYNSYPYSNYNICH